MLSPANIWRFFTVVLLSSLITACFQIAPPMPDWVKNKPNNASALYSVGQGVSLYDAEINARASMAAELSSTVSDMTRVYMVDEGAFKQESYEQFTSVEVSKVNISHARVIKQEGSVGSFHVLLELPLEDLRNQLRVQVKNAVRVVGRALVVEKNNSFEHWWQLRSVLSDAKSLARNIRLLKDFDDGLYEKETKLLASYFKRFDESFGRRVLNIVNVTNISKFQELVSEQLQHEGIELARASWRVQDYLEISIEYETQRIGKEYYVDAELWFRLKSASGRVLAQDSLKDRGVSYGGKKQSKEIAIHQLYNQLKNIDLFDRLLD